MRSWTYGVSVRQEGGDHVAAVRDLPSVVTSGDDLAQALALARDAIACDLGFLVDRARPVPRPSPILDGEHAVTLPAQLAAKLEVYDAWRAAGISKTELARRLGCSEVEVRRILDPQHGTKLERLDEAAQALGGRLEVGFARA